MGAIVQVLGDGRPGGGSTAVLTLSQLLAKQGREVVIVSQQGSYVVEEARRAGIHTYGVDFSRRVNTVSIAAGLYRRFGELKPSIVHAHGARAGLPVMLAARRGTQARPQRLVYTVHGFHFLQKPLVVHQLARAAEALCMAQADCTNFVSDGDRITAEQQGLLKRARAHRTIKNAVLVDQRLAATTKTCDIGFLGRLSPEKNPLILPEILKAMRPRRPRLSIIGGGPLEAALRERIAQAGVEDQVVMHGERTRGEALRLAAACRVLVLPSLREGHPLAPIEAMHLGIPVVGSAVSGTNEIIVEGETGYLVPARDAAAYAAALARLLDDERAIKVMGENARRRVAWEYSAERMVAAHLELYGIGDALH